MLQDIIRYPIGYFQSIQKASPELREQWMDQLSNISCNLRAIVVQLEDGHLHTPYRPGGWNIQQIAHHMADNDMNAYLRFKRALTEEEPEGSTYREDLWAELSDYKLLPVEDSISLIDLLHRRFLLLLRSLHPEDFGRKLRTQALGIITLDTALQRFVWHNQHHLAQIRTSSVRNGWLQPE